MRSITMSIPLAFIAQAQTKKLTTNHNSHVQRLMDKLADILANTLADSLHASMGKLVDNLANNLVDSLVHNKLAPKTQRRTLDAYEKLQVLSDGFYGKVYRAREKLTGNIVVMKKVKESIRNTTYRELLILQTCQHVNIVALKEVLLGRRDNRIYLVTENCEYDMANLISCMPRPFSDSEIKGLLHQLISGVAYLHQRGICHRDLKPSNLLLKAGTLKICDFGLARHLQPHLHLEYTPQVVTLSYRAPEVILRPRQYDEAIDMWSIGCIFPELLKGKPLFPANCDIEALSLMCELLGSPDQELWGNLTLTFSNKPHNRIQSTFPELKAQGLALLTTLLSWNPKSRCTAQQALCHPYFTFESPTPKRFDNATFPIVLEKNATVHRKTSFSSDRHDVGQSEKRARRVLLHNTTFPSVPTGENSDSITAICELAHSVSAQNKLEESEILFRKALTYQQQKLGCKHWTTLKLMNDLAKVLWKQDKMEDAEVLYHLALSGMKEALGKNHPKTLCTTTNLAKVLAKRRQNEEAERLYKVAFKGQEQQLGENHAEMLFTMQNLANLLQDLKRVPEAEDLFRRSFNAHIKKDGDGHPETLRAEANLAGLLLQKEELNEAATLYSHAMDGLEKVLGNHHPDTVRTVRSLAKVLRAQHNWKGAEDLYRQFWDRQSRTLGKDHLSTLQTITYLAYLMEKQNNLEEAENLYREALAVTLKQSKTIKFSETNRRKKTMTEENHESQKETHCCFVFLLFLANFGMLLLIYIFVFFPYDTYHIHRYTY